MICFFQKLYSKVYVVSVKKLFKEVGCDVRINLPINATYENITIGNHVSIGMNSTLWAQHSKIMISDKVVIGPNLTIIAGDHNISTIGKYIIDEHVKLPENDQDITIESDVWIGCNVTILKGVTIGRGAVIAACSLVIKDVPPYTIVGGNPAKVLKVRFNDEEIARHERILNIS